MKKAYGDIIICKYCHRTLMEMASGAKYEGTRICGYCEDEHQKLRDALRPEFDRLLALLKLGHE
jgi:hypothetical protein